MIAGPSGSTDGCLGIMHLFEGFDVHLATLCCITWLCNRNDHSAWEVLLAALPYGLEDYTSNQRVERYVQERLIPAIDVRWFRIYAHQL